MTTSVRLVPALALLAVGGLLTACGAPADPASGASPSASASRPTATVTRSDLVSSTTTQCELGHGATTPLEARDQGTLTALAAVGETVGQGGVLYAVDTRPVVRLTGAEPAWRQLGPSSTDGADVQQLEQALVDLGYTTGLGLTVDEDWTAATTAAVKRWQKALGETQTGTVALGDVVFTPQDVRVAEHLLDLGATVEPGKPVLAVGGTPMVVTCALRTSQAALAPVGASAHLTLPDGTTTDGTVSAVELVTTDEQQQLEVSIAATGDAVAALLEGAPVQVVLDQVVATDVLVVPVTALVALSTGGHGVEKVLDDGSTRYVQVTTGAFAGTDVEVSGDDVAEGDEVVVTP
ncbi:peptidoglycan-binding protein [Cellulomonas chitinilytica]|uniref:Peptidoglycan-binding protein n=1 Tax=Cellulomonas chitinilytica TaxID=398759 RepID=A0A919P623_9CELL|nr:peptidoglycan-binding protein [Cellulomonas chitinilytica]GIG22802.1 peptidoglycan-binding protein [Cellulomonas chitinilytica]